MAAIVENMASMDISNEAKLCFAQRDAYTREIATTVVSCVAVAMNDDPGADSAKGKKKKGKKKKGKKKTKETPPAVLPYRSTHIESNTAPLRAGSVTMISDLDARKDSAMNQRRSDLARLKPSLFHPGAVLSR